LQLDSSRPGSFRPALRRALQRAARTPLPAALGITGQVVTSLLLTGAQPSAAALGMVLCVALSSYAIDHMVDESRSGERARVLVAHAALAVALFASAVFLAHALAGALVAVLACLFPLSVAAYCLPWLRCVPALRRRGYLRIKDIPYAKNAHTALCVTAAALWAGSALGPKAPHVIVVQALAMLLSAFVNTAACDLGDLEEDRAEGVRTLAVIYGRERAAAFLSFASVAWVAVVMLGTLFGVFTAVGFVALAGGLAVVGYLRHFSGDSDIRVLAHVVPDAVDATVALVACLTAHALGV
jgi:4-hydroxybenzoate polyprenyltransferase